MIAIVNVDPDPRPAGWHEYELRINQKVIARFQHLREDDLATCLMRAAEAATKAKKENEVMLLRALMEARDNDWKLEL